MEQEKTKALVRVNPIVDASYIAVRDEITRLCKVVEAATVHSREDVERITIDVNLGQKIANKIELLRKGYKDPIVQHGKSIDAAFKLLSDPIASMRASAAGKIKKFNDEQRELQKMVDEENARIERERIEQQRLIDEQNARIAMENMQSVDRDTGEITQEIQAFIPPAEVELIEDASVVSTSRTDFGTASEKMVAKWELVNFAELPDEYKIINEKALNAIVKAGVKAIKGLKIWEEPEVSFRSK